MLDLELPSWSALVIAAAFWLLQRAVRNWVRLWALLTFPATVLHEFAHALLGYLLAARPRSLNLWPKRVSASSWRLGYVGFTNLRWWNGGAVAMAPLLWLLVIVTLLRYAPEVPGHLPLKLLILLGVGLVWLWIAVAPGRTDWTLAREYWPSAIVFMVLLGAALFVLTRVLR